MAQSTFTPPEEDKRLSVAHNPTDEAFNDIVSNYDKTASPYDKNDTINKLKAAENTGSMPRDGQAIGGTGLASTEKERSGATDAAMAVASKINPAVGVASQFVGFMRTKKGAGTGGGLLILILAMFGFSALTPAGILLNAKENGDRWSTRFHQIAANYRARQHMASRYFQDPDACKGYAVKCRYQSGTSEKELTKLKEAGFKLDTKQSASGKTFIVSMTFTNPEGKEVTADKANFKTIHKSDPHFRLLANKVINPGAVSARNDKVLEQRVKRGLFSNKLFGEETDKKKMTQKIRERIYGTNLGGKLKLNSNGEAVAEGDTDADKSTLSGVDKIDEIVATEAEKIKPGLIANGPPTDLVPDASGMLSTNDLATAGPAMVETMKGGAKGTVMGAFSAVDSACTIVNMIRLASYGAKILAAAALIKYAYMYLTVADQMKTGDIKPEQVAFLAGVLLTPSRMPATKGLDFSNSDGMKVIYEGKAARPDTMQRFSIGTTVMKALSVVQNIINTKGLSAKTCKVVKKWWAQAGLAIAGLAVCFGTLGAGCVEGALQGVAQGAIIGLVGQILFPKLVLMAAGATAPDPATDPGGGFDAGNALAAGLGVFQGVMGRANGLPPATIPSFSKFMTATETEQATMATLYKMQDQAAGTWNPENPMSVTNQLATSIGPSLYGVANIADAATSFGSLLRQGFSIIPSTLMPKASAASTLESYGGKYCVDEDINALNLARDANCNVLYAPFAETLESEQYSPEAVADYLASRSHIDPDTGEVISEQYRNFMTTCVEGSAPYTPDGEAIDIEQGGAETGQCLETDELHKAFWLYAQDQAMYSGQKDSIDDTLGIDTGLLTNPVNSAPINAATQGGALVNDSVQNLAKKILASGNITGDSRYMGQIEAYAAGNYSCNIDPLVLRTLATIVLPADQGGMGYKISLSSLNRRCTGVLTASGVGSYHYRQKGGHAFDLNFVGMPNGLRVHSTGATDNDLSLLNALIPKLPPPVATNSVPYEFGQINCRTGSRALSTPAYVNQVNDSCNHVHIGVAH